MAQGRVTTPGIGGPAGINRSAVKASPRGTRFAKTITKGHSSGLKFTGGAPPGFVFKAVVLQEANLKALIGATLISLALAAPALAQGLVDPTKVAPEYREAAEKRRAEQIRQRDCAKKADTAKVLPRERTAFLLHCLEEMEAASATAPSSAPAATTPATAVGAPAPAPANTTTTH